MRQDLGVRRSVIVDGDAVVEELLFALQVGLELLHDVATRHDAAEALAARRCVQLLVHLQTTQPRNMVLLLPDWYF